jgi:excisionase family DNA binding protein
MSVSSDFTESCALLDVRQVASLLNVSPRTVYRLCDGAKMPRPIRLGALVRWERSAVVTWIQNGCPAIRTASPARTVCDDRDIRHARS